MGQGRRAALPPVGFQPRPRLLQEQNSVIVRFVPEDRAASGKDYDFTGLPLTLALRTAFASAFAERVRPGGGLRARKSADHEHYRLSKFAEYLASLRRPPRRASEVSLAHVQGWYLQRSGLASATRELQALKATLKKLPGASAEFLAGTGSDRGYPQRSTRTASYSREEFDRILNTARHDVRRAADRIRANRLFLAQWRAGDIDREQDQPGWRRGRVLDQVDREADVPRYPTAEPKHWVAALGTVTEHVTALHLTPLEAAAFTVLLVGLTGQNRGTIITAPAAHHRPDGYADSPATAIVELDKPRRGPHRHMDVALLEVPEWVPAPRESPGRDGNEVDLRSPFGVYMLLHELSTPARRILGTDRLLVWAASTGRPGTGRGLRTGLHPGHVAGWAKLRDLVLAPPPTSPGKDASEDIPVGLCEPAHVALNLPRLRLTHIELRQRPVAHSQRTVANDYLLRNRGNIAEYQKVVASVLATEVTKARTRAALGVLTAAEVEHARTDANTVAARHGLDADTLLRMIGGELDTVMTACADPLASPHHRPGQPCQASFMLCLSCPNARSLPHHLPLQVAVHDALQDRQREMTPLRWAQRFGLPHAQLADLLEQARTPAVLDARVQLTDNQRELVDRFLDRALDVS
jgi:hypothetical protein